MRYCRDNPNFYVKIFFDNRRKTQLFNEVIHEEVENGEIPHVREVRYSNASLHIYFDNGSDISIETYNPGARYFIAHYLIADFDDELDPFLETYLRSRIHTYHPYNRVGRTYERPEVEYTPNGDLTVTYKYSVIEPNRDNVATDEELKAFIYS